MSADAAAGDKAATPSCDDGSVSGDEAGAAAAAASAAASLSDNGGAASSTSKLDEKESAAEANKEQLKLREKTEATLTDDERNQLRDEAARLKAEGNDEFGQGYWYEAAKCYTEALDKCPLVFTADRALFLSNRAATYMKLCDWESAIVDCTEALELGAPNEKPLERRAYCYSHLEEKLEKAVEDYESLIKIRPDEDRQYADKISLLKKQINERNEKLKEEMIGKLKDLGNMCLKPFGLSTDSFQLEKQNGGGYSISMKK